MKYPITPEYMEAAPKKLIRLYEDFEADVLADICRRLRISGTVTESALNQIRIMQEQGKTYEYIEKRIRQLLNVSKKELEKMFEDAVNRNEDYLKTALEKSDITRPKNEWRNALTAQTEAIRQQTAEKFQNLTQSMGFAIREGSKVQFYGVAEVYQRILDRAALELSTGAMDYNTVIRQAVKELAENGIMMVDYASGWRNRADVAVRRAVMTGVSQISSQYSEMAAEVLKTPLREVSAHRGARDIDGPKGWENHKKWQGKVYALGYHPKYPDIYKECGWGDVTGLEGANCRHMHFAFVEGVSKRRWTDEQLANIDPPPFEYQGKTYTAYEATQKQRQIETAMRKCKREIVGYEAAGQTESFQDSSIRLRRLSAEYKAFSKAAGLREQPERATVVGFGTKQAAKATQAANRHYIEWSKGIGANTSVETLAKYYDVKYNDSPRYNLLKQYAEDVQTGWISPNSGFDNYERLYNKIQSEIVGKTTSNGILITGQKPHFMQRVIGTMVDPKILKNNLKVVRRSGVDFDDIAEALFRPVDVAPIAKRPSGQRSQKFIGKKCVVTINPDTGQLIQTNLIGG